MEVNEGSVVPPAVSVSAAGGLPLGQKLLRFAIYHRCDLCRAKDKTLNRPTIFPRFSAPFARLPFNQNVYIIMSERTRQPVTRLIIHFFFSHPLRISLHRFEV